MTEVEVRVLVLMGEACLRLGDYWYACYAFEAAGAEMTRDRLVTYDEKALAKGWLAVAHEAFAAAGHKEGLIACGEKALTLKRQRPGKGLGTGGFLT